jgi:hypothetical protein
MLACRREVRGERGKEKEEIRERGESRERGE